MGGFIAAEVAVREPEWVDRLVLVSSAGISHATMRKGPVVAGARISVATNPAAAARRPRLDAAAGAAPGRLRQGDAAPRASSAASSSSSSWRRRSARPGFIPAVAALTGYDLLDRLRQIRVPTLIVWGRDDLVVPASDSTGFVERIPGAELVVFEDCGHVPMAERPTRFNRLLARFCETAHA